MNSDVNVIGKLLNRKQVNIRKKIEILKIAANHMYLFKFDKNILEALKWALCNIRDNKVKVKAKLKCQVSWNAPTKLNTCI